ncbi:MAG TPA: hypothetical protein VF828_03700 [Patescibacteria group bacterium]
MNSKQRAVAGLSVLVIFLSVVMFNSKKRTNPNTPANVQTRAISTGATFVESQPAAKQKISLEELLTGVWQAKMIKTELWSDRYHFYNNGNFHFYYNQADCQKRDIAKEGKWKIVKGNLVLTIISVTTMEGGNYEKTSSICNSAIELVNAKEVKKDLKIPEIIEYPISKTSDDEVPPKLSIRINNQQFWKFYNDPSQEDR